MWLILQAAVVYGLMKFTMYDIVGVLFLTMCAAAGTMLLAAELTGYGDPEEEQETVERRDDDLRVQYILLRSNDEMRGRYKKAQEV